MGVDDTRKGYQRARLRHILERKLIVEEPTGFAYAPVSCKVAARLLKKLGLAPAVPARGHVMHKLPDVDLVNNAGVCEFQFLDAAGQRRKRGG